jgi:hypothetical protein
MKLVDALAGTFVNDSHVIDYERCTMLYDGRVDGERP